MTDNHPEVLDAFRDLVRDGFSNPSEQAGLGERGLGLLRTRGLSWLDVLPIEEARTRRDTASLSGMIMGLLDRVDLIRPFDLMTLAVLNLNPSAGNSTWNPKLLHPAEGCFVAWSDIASRVHAEIDVEREKLLKRYETGAWL